LGIKVLDIKNSCLLSKWLFKLLNEKGMWQELIHNKYLKTKTLSQVQAKPTDSPFRKGILRGKDVFFQRGSFVVGDGLSTRFWEDPWLKRTPLMNEYPSLYSIVSHKNVTVAEILNQQPLNIGFRRVLSGDRWTTWLQLVERLMKVNLTDDSDSFIWHLTESGIFSVKSLYTDLMNGHTRFLHKYLWKIKVPLRIKIFM
jgi:hypothetical protein